MTAPDDEQHRARITGDMSAYAKGGVVRGPVDPDLFRLEPGERIIAADELGGYFREVGDDA